MSLDFAILSKTGHPLRSIPIGMDFHNALIDEAERADSELVLRMAEYYEHARYEPSDLPALADELTGLETARSSDPVFAENITKMKALVSEAQQSALQVMAIAD